MEVEPDNFINCQLDSCFDRVWEPTILILIAIICGLIGVIVYLYYKNKSLKKK